MIVSLVSNCIFSNNSTLAGHINVGDYVVLAGMTAVHQFCSIGNHAFVTGGSLVRKDVPPFRESCVANHCLMSELILLDYVVADFQLKKSERFKIFYRMLYQKNYNNTQASDLIEAEMEATPERDEILTVYKEFSSWNHERVFQIK